MRIAQSNEPNAIKNHLLMLDSDLA
jgi:hypothetical protein